MKREYPEKFCELCDRCATLIDGHCGVYCVEGKQYLCHGCHAQYHGKDSEGRVLANVQ